MTDFGLNIRNASQQIQIDSLYRNLVLNQGPTSKTVRGFAASGFVANDEVGSKDWDIISLPGKSSPPLFLWQPSTVFSGIGAIQKIGDVYDRVAFYSEYGKIHTITYKLYDEDNQESPEEFGLRVWNGDGDLCYDSGKKYLKIVSAHVINLPTPANTYYGTSLPAMAYVDISHPTISNPYYFFCNSDVYNSSLYDAGSRYQDCCHFRKGIKKKSSNTVRVGWFLTGFSAVAMWQPYKDGYYGGTNNPAILLVCK